MGFQLGGACNKWKAFLLVRFLQKHLNFHEPFVQLQYGTSQNKNISETSSFNSDRWQNKPLFLTSGVRVRNAVQQRQLWLLRDFALTQRTCVKLGLGFPDSWYFMIFHICQDGMSYGWSAKICLKKRPFWWPFCWVTTKPLRRCFFSSRRWSQQRNKNIATASRFRRWTQLSDGVHCLGLPRTWISMETYLWSFSRES